MSLPTKQQVRAALDELSAIQSLEDWFIQRGVKGVKLNERHCPIAEHLRSAVGDTPCVGTAVVWVNVSDPDDDAGFPLRADGAYGFSLPPNCRDFIKQFDEEALDSRLYTTIEEL